MTQCRFICELSFKSLTKFLLHAWSCDWAGRFLTKAMRLEQPPKLNNKKSQGNTYSIVRSWPGLWLASIDAVDRLACKLEGGLGSEWKWNICERVTGCYTVEAKYGAPGKRNSTDGPSIEWMWWRRIFSINGRSLGFTRLDLDLNLQKFWNMTDLQYYSAGWQHGTTMCSSWETGKPGGRSWGDQLISQQ